MIETKELYFKNSPLETHEIASKHVLYWYISPYDIPGLKASKICCQCVDLLCQSYGNTHFTNPKLWLCQSQIPFTVDNQILENCVYKHWNLNETWQELAMLYVL